ncbi:MAG: sigma-54-dependent transcriptional regulator [bacterium]
MVRLGVVDDDLELANLVANEIPQDTLTTEDPQDVLDWVREDRVDGVFSDLKMGSVSGIDLLEEIRSMNEVLPVVIMTGYGSIDTAVEAMKKGAYDYIEKPIEGQEIRAVAQRLNDQIKNQQQLEGFRESQRIEEDTKYQLIGSSDPMADVREMIDQLAPQSMSVLIKGETGTGKEIIARQLHAKSRRADSPLMTVNCAAIPGNLLEEELFGHEKGAFTGADETKKGKLELADEGTVFLDEIGELPLELQPKLLRVLEQGEVTKVGGEFPREVDVRFIAATNRDMKSMLEEQSFRKDLYYRLNSLEIKSPALREHPEDIPELADYFLDQMAGKMNSVPRPTEQALEELKGYHWPGNVRELKNIIERCAVLVNGDSIDVDKLPDEITGKSTPSGGYFNWEDYGESLPDALENLEMEIINDVISTVEGNKAEAARRLGISRQSLQYKLDEKS